MTLGADISATKSRPPGGFFLLANRFRVLCLMAVALLSACAGDDAYHTLSGPTMGTSWHVTYRSTSGMDEAAVRSAIEEHLEAVNAAMSTYRPDSEISRLNAAPAGEWSSLSSDFYTVLVEALSVGEKAGGAYDITVGPLVSLWGFGPGGTVISPPEEAELAAVAQRVGQAHVQVDTAGQRVLRTAPVELDLSSIAKGYAVDRIADWLSAREVNDYLVEVGGEMRLSGVSPRADRWRIAIEKPVSDERAVAATLAVSDVAIATSGDYRNFFEHDGVRYSHTVDPRTGRPVRHDLASVTVLNASAMRADAWATALNAMGPEEALRAAEQHGLAVYLIRRYDQGYTALHSSAFEPWLPYLTVPEGAAQ